jgi:metal-dependent hydrolase (beta-lactamase superfamily II)
MQAGYDFLKVGKIFITLPHSDHTNGLATLLALRREVEAALGPKFDQQSSAIPSLFRGC